jgi:hypothetical protein
MEQDCNAQQKERYKERKRKEEKARERNVPFLSCLQVDPAVSSRPDA